MIHNTTTHIQHISDEIAERRGCHGIPTYVEGATPIPSAVAGGQPSPMEYTAQITILLLESDIADAVDRVAEHLEVIVEFYADGQEPHAVAASLYHHLPECNHSNLEALPHTSHA